MQRRITLLQLVVLMELVDARWADAESYDLVVDTDCLGIQGAKKVIIASLSEINR